MVMRSLHSSKGFLRKTYKESANDLSKELKGRLESQMNQVYKNYGIGKHITFESHGEMINVLYKDEKRKSLVGIIYIDGASSTLHFEGCTFNTVNDTSCCGHERNVYRISQFDVFFDELVNYIDDYEHTLLYFERRQRKQRIFRLAREI